MIVTRKPRAHSRRADQCRPKTPGAHRWAPPGRLTLVGPLPPPSGGMANQTRQLARLLAAEGTDVRIVQTNAPYSPSWMARIPVSRGGPARAVPVAVVDRHSRRGRRARHGELGLGVAPLCGAGDLDRADPRRAVVVNYRGGEAELVLRAAGPLDASYTAAGAGMIVARALGAMFAAHGVPRPIVPNVVNLAAFRPAAAAACAPHLGRHPQSGADLRHRHGDRAFALVAKVRPRARMTIAGSGPQRAELERLAAEQGVGAVRFTGRLDDAELPELYQSATLTLNPSLTDNMPNSLLEAMASGVPIVSTNVGGIPYLVEDGVSALLVPFGDAQAMARCALRILGDPALGVRLARAGLEASRGYAWAKVRSDLFAVYVRAGRGNARTSVQA